MTTLTLNDPYGVRYPFTFYGISQILPPLGGVYVVTRLEGVGGQHRALYIGRCQNFRERHQSHHKRVDFILHGATHIGCHVVGSESARMEVEARLIRQYSPLLNEVLPSARSLNR